MTKKTLAAAASIVSVEARHAAWIRDIARQAAGAGRVRRRRSRPGPVRRHSRPASSRGERMTFEDTRVAFASRTSTATARCRGRWTRSSAPTRAPGSCARPRSLGGGRRLAALGAPRRRRRRDHGRRGDPQLRADARVPRGGVLHRGRAQMGALTGELASVRRRRRRARAGARRGAQEGARRSNAVKKPTFDFQGTTEDEAKFRRPRRRSRTRRRWPTPARRRDHANAVLGAALAIHTVEARHAAWIRHLNGATPAPARSTSRGR